MKMWIFAILLFAGTSVSCFAQTSSPETKNITFEERYRKDLRPLCQSEPINENQNHRHLKHNDTLSRIGHGRPAVRNEFPYATVLFKFHRDDEDISGYCGSTLITDKHVVTARHCLTKKNLDDVDMGVGEVDLRAGQPHLIHRSGGFSKGTGERDDIAIIELADSVTFGHNEQFGRDVYVAHLPGPNYVIKKDEVMSIFGWGETDKSNDSVTLKTINVKLADKGDKRCYEPNSVILCVLGEHSFESSCKGDSGSGMIFRDYGKDVVVGLVSQSFGDCGSNHVPMDFTRISAYAEYIYKHTLNALCKPSFVFSNKLIN